MEEASKVNRITLKFSNSLTEDEFLRSRSGHLAFNLSLCTFIGFITASITMLLNWSSPPLPIVTASQKAVYTRVQLSLGSTMILAFMVLSVLRIPRLFEKIGTRSREVLALFVSIAFAMMVVPAEWYFMAKLSGLDPEQMYDSVCFSDKQLLLFLVSITAAVHNTLPVRWCLLVIEEIATIAVYGAVVLLLDTPAGKGEGLYSLLILTFLVCCSSFGVRQMERHERKTLLTYIDEKQRRFQIEFKLSQLENSVQQPNPASLSQEEVASLPSETLTGQMWNDNSETIESFLSTLSHVGRAEQWLIESEGLRVNIDHFLGAGGYGFVLSGSFHGTLVAVKLPRSSILDQASRSQIISLCTEIRIMRRLRHPHLVALYGVLMDVEHGGLALVMEFVHGIILKDFIGGDRKCNVQRDDRCQILVDLCCALRYLHSRRPRIVHGDLKHSNIMVERLMKGVRAKILDFGLSRLLTRNSKPLGGTIHWMAPEVTRRVRPDTAADVFSFGRVAFFTATGLQPLQGMAEKKIRSLSKRGQVPSLAWPRDCPLGHQVMPIVQECTQHEVSSRPRMTEVHSSICLIANLPGNASKNTDDGERRILRCLQKMFQGHLETFEQGDTADPTALSHVPEPLSPAVPLAQVPENEIVVQIQPQVQVPESASVSQSVKLVAPRFRPTPVSSQLGFMLLLLKSCNIPADSKKCCSYHDALDVLETSCKRLSLAKCSPGFFDDILGQCSTCGLMTLAAPGPDAMCLFCDRATSACERVRSQSSSSSECEQRHQLIPL